MVKQIRVLGLIMVVVATSFSVDTASAVADPCAPAARYAASLERRVLSTQNAIYREIDRLQRSQNQVAFRQAVLAAQIQEAQALYDASGSIANGDLAGCTVGAILFGRNRGCFGGSISRGIAARARAQARLTAAQARYQNYVVYSQGFIQRMAARVTFAQQLFDQANAQYQAAQATVTQCRQATIGAVM